jgi:hypothetical protein
MFPNIADAAEKLNVAERTLRDYEAKGTAPPDIMDRMATLFRKPILRYLYCGYCVIGQKIHPEVAEKHLTDALMRLNNSVVGIDVDCKDMALILDDGIIAEDEKSRTIEIMSRLKTAKQRIAEFVVNIETRFPNEITDQPPSTSNKVC